MCSHLPVDVIWFDIVFLWTGTCFFILFSISYINICQQYVSDSRKKETHLFRILTSFTIVAFVLCSSFDIAHIAVHYMECSNFQSHTEAIIAGCADIAYFVASISFYSMLIIRMRFLFKETFYRISYYTLFILFFLVFIIMFFAVWHCYTTAFNQHNSDYTPKERPATLALSISDFLLNISLFLLFYYKLRQTIMSFECGKVLSNYDASHRLLQVISKHSILFGIAVIANQCFYIGIIVEEISHIDRINYTKAILILFSARALENLINVIVVWLMLAINLNIYYKLCGYCHIKVQTCCKYCISSANNSVVNSQYISRVISDKSINYTSTTDYALKYQDFGSTDDDEDDEKNKVLSSTQNHLVAHLFEPLHATHTYS